MSGIRSILNRYLPFGILAVGAGIYLQRVFTCMPFLQQESMDVGQWWLNDSTPFFEKLFNTIGNDHGAGRFRYLHYLFESAYWNAFANGFLPFDFYDYAAIAVTAILALALYTILRRQGLAPWLSAVVVAVFLISTHSYQISVFNYRRAKYLLTLLFAAFILFPEKWRKKPYLEIGLVVAGFFLDPQFILLIPFLALSLDAIRNTQFQTFRRTVIGLALSFGLLLFLSGVIGPIFSPAAKLPFGPIENKPSNLLEISNVKEFPLVLGDLFFPLQTAKTMWGLIGWSIAVLFGCYVLFKKGWKKAPFLFLLLAALPVCAFQILPTSSSVVFAGYYGHTLLFIALLAAVDVFREKPALLIGLLLVVSYSHFAARKEVYRRFILQNVETEKTFVKYVEDYRLVKDTALTVKDPKARPLYVNIDWERAPHNQFYILGYEWQETGNERGHTSMIYKLYPKLFSKAIADGRLVLSSLSQGQHG